MSPKSRGRPSGRGRPQQQRRPARQLRLSDRLLRDAGSIVAEPDLLTVERWASGWLGQARYMAGMAERDPEKALCLEVVGRASSRPSPPGLAAVAALRRVAPETVLSILDGTVEILSASQPRPPWADTPPATAVAAWRAVDVWDSERVLFVEYAEPIPHTLLVQILTVGGVLVEKLGLLHSGAAAAWEQLRELDDVPMPLSECPVEATLAELADALRITDMTWPRQDDEDFVDLRCLAWSRCRAHLPAWPDPQRLTDEERGRLIDDFAAVAGSDESGEAGRATDGEDTTRSLADLFLDFGEGYISAGPLCWSPGWVGMFLGDWLPRKGMLDAAQRAALPETLRRWVRFALHRRGVDPQWIVPVVEAVDTHLPEFTEAFDDDSAWGPAKQIAAELAARGLDLSDRDAVDAAIRALNAERLARLFLDDEAQPYRR